jgi:hypothetical protein
MSVVRSDREIELDIPVMEIRETFFFIEYWDLEKQVLIERHRKLTWEKFKSWFNHDCSKCKGE